MSPENFCFWLRGFFELAANFSGTLSKSQVRIIKEHLDLVLRHAPRSADPSVMEPPKGPAAGPPASRKVISEAQVHKKPAHGILDVLSTSKRFKMTRDQKRALEKTIEEMKERMDRNDHAFRNIYPGKLC